MLWLLLLAIGAQLWLSMTKRFAYGFSIWFVLPIGCWLDCWWDHPKLQHFLWPSEPGGFLLDLLQTLASLLLLAGGVGTSCRPLQLRSVAALNGRPCPPMLQQNPTAPVKFLLLSGFLYHEFEE